MAEQLVQHRGAASQSDVDLGQPEAACVEWLANDPATGVILLSDASTAPERPAVSANGTARPSAMPITTSRTVSEAR